VNLVEGELMPRFTSLVHPLTILCLVCSVTATAAQYPLPAQPHPHPIPIEPLMYVRFAAPVGVRVTFYRGGPVGETFTAPFTAGFRPGYIYRFKMSGLPGRAEEFSLYPTLEVRSVLSLPPGQRAVNYPAPLVLSDDVDRVLAGSLVTRVISLEDPERAVPVATRPDQPLEFQAPPGRDPVEEAREHGRPFLIFRVGQREFSVEELTQHAVTGTVFLPGDKYLPAPQYPPYLQWTCLPLFDPILGPRLTPEIFVKDGGDVGLRAGVNPEGKLVGLDTTDTVARYLDSCGRPHVAVSNRVCLLVPRFIHTRGEIAPIGQVALLGPGRTSIVVAQNTLLTKVPPLVALQNEQPVGLVAKQQLSLSMNRYGPQVVGRVEGTRTFITAQETLSLSGACKPEPCEPEVPLKIIKWPDVCTAQIGEVVTFHLKYINAGGKAINEVAVSDNLSPRLEYVPGSAKSDRDMTFTTRPNEAGSVILRWQLNGPLPPHQFGIISFQARVR
jgi:uncharacterized repeat protein (TIGR01451 family)